jgi:hypothetical protein
MAVYQMILKRSELPDFDLLYVSGRIWLASERLVERFHARGITGCRFEEIPLAD